MICKVLLSGVAVAALTTGAYATDLPSIKGPPVYVPPPVYTWTGFYGGGTAGYSWNNLAVTNIDYDPIIGALGALPGGGNSNLPSSGVALGGTAGYNYQIRGFVIGVEADGSWLSNRTSTYGAFDAIFNASHQTFNSKIDALVTGRIRLGVAVDPALLYVTGGVAAGHVENSYVAKIYEAPEPTWSDCGWRVGWTAGAGVEVKIDQNWSVKGEGLYYQLASDTVAVPVPITEGDPITTINHVRFADQGFIARVGLNYLFGAPPAPAPVLAKY